MLSRFTIDRVPPREGILPARCRNRTSRTPSEATRHSTPPIAAARPTTSFRSLRNTGIRRPSSCLPGCSPDSKARPHRGWDAILRFTANQMEAFTELRIEPLEFSEIGECLVVPYRFGGRARHTRYSGGVLVRTCLHLPRWESNPMRGVQDQSRRPRSRRAVGVGDVGGERGAGPSSNRVLR